jgi:hypothetical protein
VKQRRHVRRWEGGGEGNLSRRARGNMPRALKRQGTEQGPGVEFGPLAGSGRQLNQIQSLQVPTGIKRLPINQSNDFVFRNRDIGAAEIAMGGAYCRICLFL